MILVVEGPDGGGKSTLARRLSSQNNYSLIHRVAPETERDEKDMFASYMREVAAHRNLVYDRAFYSDLAYGPVFRNGAVLTMREVDILEETLGARGAIIIYCTGDRDAMWNRCKERNADNPGGTKFEEDRAKFEAVCDAYDAIMTAPHYIPVVRYDIDYA